MSNVFVLNTELNSTLGEVHIEPVLNMYAFQTVASCICLYNLRPNTIKILSKRYYYYIMESVTNFLT